jgi:hypothetical protein
MGIISLLETKLFPSYQNGFMRIDAQRAERERLELHRPIMQRWYAKQSIALPRRAFCGLPSKSPLYQAREKTGFALLQENYEEYFSRID